MSKPLPMKSVAPTAQHLAFRKAIEDTMKAHIGELGALDVLALLAHLVGQVIALQDQRTVTADMAMELVISNIEHGNAEVLERLRDEVGGHA